MSKYKWPSGTLMPGEDKKRALRRRVRFHEFIASGGIAEGYVNGKMTYSDPVDPMTEPECPWHGENCEAWAVLREQGGTAEDPIRPNLAERREMDVPVSTRRTRIVPEPEPDIAATAFDALTGEELPDEITIEGDEDARECANCGEEVLSLSSRDWCDGCEEEASK